MKTQNAIEFYQLDVSSISLPKGSTKVISPDDIEVATKAIMATGGLIAPLLVKQTGLMTYELLDESQSLLFLASQQAKAIDVRRFEMVNAFVIDGVADQAVSQLKALGMI